TLTVERRATQQATAGQRGFLVGGINEQRTTIQVNSRVEGWLSGVIQSPAGQLLLVIDKQLQSAVHISVDTAVSLSCSAKLYSLGGSTNEVTCAERGCGTVQGCCVERDSECFSDLVAEQADVIAWVSANHFSGDDGDSRNLLRCDRLQAERTVSGWLLT